MDDFSKLIKVISTGCLSPCDSVHSAVTHGKETPPRGNQRPQDPPGLIVPPVRRQRFLFDPISPLHPHQHLISLDTLPSHELWLLDQHQEALKSKSLQLYFVLLSDQKIIGRKKSSGGKKKKGKIVIRQVAGGSLQVDVALWQEASGSP